MAAVTSHPRDDYVLYQEQLERANEGDEIDISTYRKVKVDQQENESGKSSATFSFSHEDHTVGNALRFVLMHSPDVITAGYSIPHPLEPKMVLHLQSRNYAVDAVTESLEGLATMCDQWAASFDAAVEASAQ